MVNPIVLTDADNTLWDTDSVFSSAQLGLLASVETMTSNRYPGDDRLEFVRRYDQALAAIHHAHLKYPPTLLVRALEMALGGAEPATAAAVVCRGGHASMLEQSAIDLAVEAYFSLLGSLPDLLPTVREGLELLRDAGIRPYVLTEGKIEKQKKILLHYSLNDLVSGIFEVAKDRAQFERLRLRFSPAEVVTIGDQIDRDIIPAKAAGCTTVLVPGRFRPYWHQEDQATEASLVASTFAEGVQWILQLPR
jgi:putative hydrolase of the HAD superfamily